MNCHAAYSQQDEELQSLLSHYSAEIDQNKRYVDQEYIDRILDREMTLLTTLKDHKFISHTFILNDETIDFIYHNKMIPTSFHNTRKLLIQHLITKEIIHILESSVESLHKNPHNKTLANFFTHNCNVALAAQQLNQQNHIGQALILTDCCHFFKLYGESILDETYDKEHLDVEPKNLENILQDTQQTGVTLYKYIAFAERLYNAPKTLLNELVCDLHNIADCLHNITDEINQITPSHTIPNDQSTGLLTSLHRCKEIMDNEYTNKAALLFLCTSASRHLAQSSTAIETTITPQFLTSPIGFAKTMTGEIITFSEETNEIVTTKNI